MKGDGGDWFSLGSAYEGEGLGKEYTRVGLREDEATRSQTMGDKGKRGGDEGVTHRRRGLHILYMYIITTCLPI